MAVIDFIINFTDPLKGNFIIKPYTSDGNRFPTTNIKNSTSTVASSPLLLYGKGHPDYGERTDENLLHIAENFSGPSRPIITATGDTLTGIIWHREVLYYIDTTGPSIYQWNGGSWTGPVGSSGLIAGRPAAPANGTVYYATDTLELFRYSDDEREIQSWIEIERTLSTGDPNTGSPILQPVRELQVNHDGTSSGWEVVPDSAALDSAYLRLDASNGPMQANLDMGGFIITNLDELQTQDGSAGDPSYAFSNDLNSGMYLIGASILGFSTSSSERLRIDSSGVLSVDGGGADTGYAALVSSQNDVPNKKYVDDAAAGAAGADTFVNSGSFSPGVLTLNYNGSPLTFFNVLGLTADNITFTTSSPLFSIGSTNVTDVEDALTTLDAQKPNISGEPTYTGTHNFISGTIKGPAPLANDDLTTKLYVDTTVSSGAPYLREIVTGITTTVIPLSFTYLAGNNRMSVYKNGVKLYRDDDSGSPIVEYGYFEAIGSPLSQAPPASAASGVILHTAPIISDVFEFIKDGT